MALSIQNIIPKIGAEFHGTNPDSKIDNVSIDSRSLQNNNATLFFALVGPNNDAHIYLEELIEKGVQNFVVTYIPESLNSKANFLKVKNTTEALQQFAVFYRNLYAFPVV